MQISAQDRRTQAEAAATAWWSGKPFPEASWGRPYLCDVCGAQIAAREGTSLVASRLQCVKCTDRTFPNSPTPAPSPDPARQYVPYPVATAPAPPQPTVWAPPATTPPPAMPGSAAALPTPVVPTPPPSAPPVQPPAAGPRRRWGLIGLVLAAVAGLVVGLLVWAPWVKHAPNVPVNVRGTAVTATSVLVRWNAAESGRSVDVYVVQRNGKEVGTVSGSETSYLDEKLTPGTSYKYSVIASAGSLRSGASAEVAATTTLPSPGDLSAGSATTTSLSFSWSAPPDSPVPDKYVVLRDGATVATVGGSTTSYRDTGLEPVSTHEYQVSAVWSGHTSVATAGLKLTTRSPAVSAARLEGSWSVNIKVRSSGGGTMTAGKAWINSWRFTPGCSSGPCSVVVSGAIAPGGFTTHRFTATLTRQAGGIYTGRTTAHITHCGEKPLVVDVQNTITIRLTVTAAAMDSGVWSASKLAGSMTMDSPYTSAGSYFCPAQTVSTYLSA